MCTIIEYLKILNNQLFMVLDKTFVIMGLEPWNDENPSEVEFIARNLAEQNRVLYVNPPTDLASLLDQKNYKPLLGSSGGGSSVDRAIRRVDGQLWVLDPPIILTPLNDRLNDRLFDFINRHNNKRLAKTIMWAARNLGLHPQWLINASSVFNGYYMPQMLGVDRAVYLRARCGIMNTSLCGHQGRLEPKIAHEYDAVVACAELLCTDLRALNCNTFNIGQGFDFENYNVGTDHIMPEEMRDVPRPIIGYVGSLDDESFSVALVERLACAVPTASILLIDTNYNKRRSRALPLSQNIYMISAAESTSYADYIAHFDVCINPQSSLSHADVYYPQNVMRSLAMGKIVVSTSTKAIECLRYNILIADSGNEFIEYVKLALRHCEAFELEKRFSEFASLHSWEMVGERLYGVIEMMGGVEQSAEKTKCAAEAIPS